MNCKWSESEELSWLWDSFFLSFVSLFSQSRRQCIEKNMSRSQVKENLLSHCFYINIIIKRLNLTHHSILIQNVKKQKCFLIKIDCKIRLIRIIQDFKLNDWLNEWFELSARLKQKEENVWKWSHIAVKPHNTQILAWLDVLCELQTFKLIENSFIRKSRTERFLPTCPLSVQNLDEL